MNIPPQTDLYTDWLEIDLSAFRHNLTRIAQITGRPVMAVIKANGYGHGILGVGRAALAAGAAWLAVARVEEALDLRRAGIDAPLLVLGYTQPGMASAAAAANITLAVGDPQVARAYSDAAGAAPLTVHAKIDTGMGRLGVLAEDGVEFVHQLYGLPGLSVGGIFTHFASADEPQKDTTAWQLERFCGVLDGLNAAGIRPPLVHAANSAACIYHPQTYFDMVRPGIVLYGLNPSPQAPAPADFRPPLAWKTRLTSVKMLPAGHGVSYCWRYVTPAPQRIGALAVGYGDGLRRTLNVNFALVGGRRVPVLGTVCMDQVMVPLDDLPEARIGDEVVLIGSQQGAQISTDEVAAAWGTINYEVVCGLGARVPRVYLNEA